MAVEDTKETMAIVDLIKPNNPKPDHNPQIMAHASRLNLKNNKSTGSRRYFKAKSTPIFWGVASKKQDIAL